MAGAVGPELVFPEVDTGVLTSYEGVRRRDLRMLVNGVSLTESFEDPDGARFKTVACRETWPGR